MPLIQLDPFTCPSPNWRGAIRGSETDISLCFSFRYYILITACLLGNKSELLKQVCLAAALIFPTMAAIHAVLLAALHNDGRSLDPSSAGELTTCSRVCRYGYLWSIPFMRNRHLGCSRNRQTVQVSLNPSEQSFIPVRFTTALLPKQVLRVWHTYDTVSNPNFNPFRARLIYSSAVQNLLGGPRKEIDIAMGYHYRYG